MSFSQASFIIVDDSRLDCFISEKIIRNSGHSESVRSFTEALKALEFIKNTPITAHNPKTVILLDIQMPVMNGFEFAEAFEELPDNHKASYVIFMVSSSTNESDRIRIGNYPSIRQLFKKPLNKEMLTELLDMVMVD
jgi:CheY-like chemotaxis protein